MKYCLLFTLALVGCASLNTVSYDRKTIHTSKTIHLNLKSGKVVGHQGSLPIDVSSGHGYEVPVEFSSNERLQFSVEDQKAFVSNLANEITRLKMANVTQTQSSDANVELYFIKTEHFMPTHRYLLNVHAEIRSGNREPFKKTYFIDSEAGLSESDKMNNTASDGKTRASKQLMARVIPDIEVFLK